MHSLSVVAEFLVSLGVVTFGGEMLSLRDDVAVLRMQKWQSCDQQHQSLVVLHSTWI